MGAGSSKRDTRNTQNIKSSGSKHEELNARSTTNENSGHNQKNFVSRRETQKNNNSLIAGSENVPRNESTSNSIKNSRPGAGDRWNTDHDFDSDDSIASEHDTQNRTKKQPYPAKNNNLTTTRGREKSSDSKEKELNVYNQQKSNTSTTEYPETYAQRQLREQYTATMLRQKTMYRDPDEWELSSEEEENKDFDPNKFRTVNKVSQKDKDIFNVSSSPQDTKVNIHRTGPDPDLYYEPKSEQKQKDLPKYDITEEELMQDIEREFDF